LMGIEIGPPERRPAERRGRTLFGEGPIRRLLTEWQPLLPRKRVLGNLLGQETIVDRVPIEDAIEVIAGSSWAKNLAEGVCLTGDTLVYTNPSASEISGEITSVLGYDGFHHPVINRFEREYEGELIEIQPLYGLKLRLTSEHPIAYRRNGKLRCRDAKYVKTGDFLIMPKMVEVEDIEFIELPHVNENHGYRQAVEMYSMGASPDKISKILGINKVTLGFWLSGRYKPKFIDVPDKIPVNGEILEFLGLYVAEGFTHGSKISFALSREEGDLANLITEIAKRYFNRETWVRSWRGTKSICMSFSCLPLAKFLRENFYDGGFRAINKALPGWLMRLPPTKQSSFLRGLWLGDGCIGKNSYRYSTSSEKLAMQVRMMLMRLDILPSIKVVQIEPHKYGDRIVKPRKPKYTIQVFGSAQMERMSKLLKLPKPAAFEQKRDRAPRFRNNGLYIEVPVVEVKRVPFKGKVYNLAVESEWYTANGILVHNCGAKYVGLTPGTPEYERCVYNVSHTVAARVLGTTWTPPPAAPARPRRR
jgi:intein/homing endonuclease